jgi:hypothetical protein
MKTSMRSMGLLAFLLTLCACTGGSLVDQALNTSGSEVGAVQVMALQHRHDGASGDLTDTGTKLLTNDLGYEIEMVEALINFHALRLISEGEDPTCLPGFDQEVSLHKAHDLLLEDLLTYVLGTAIIPKMNFCRFEILIGGEDEHGADTELASAFLLSGHWSLGGNSGDFDFSGEEAIAVSGVFQAEEDGTVIEHPIHFHEGEDVVEALFGIAYDEIFTGVDFQNQSPEEQLETVHHNLEHAVHQHTGEHHGGGEEAPHEH